MMQPFNPDVDRLVTELGEQLKLIGDELQLKANADNPDPLECALFLNHRLCKEYFFAASDELRAGRLIAGAALARASVENTIDIMFILSDTSKQEDRAKKYVASMRGYEKAAFDAAKQMGDLTNRPMKKKNDWTGASLEDRMKTVGPAIANVYDMLCYFGHPNPGALVYYRKRGLYEAQLNLLKQLSCVPPYMCLLECIVHANVSGLDHKILEELGDTLGMEIGELFESLNGEKT